MSDAIIESVKQMYDETGVYWSQTRKYNWAVTQGYLDRLVPGQAVLDVGCGNGRLVSGLPKGVEYTGIDFSQTLLSEAKKNFPRFDFRYGNIIEADAWENLEQYDAILCVAVLHHIPTREQQLFVLHEMRRHLKTNGLLYLSVWNLWQERFTQSHLESVSLKLINPRYVEIPFNKKWRRFCVQMDIPYLIDLAAEAGWNIEEIFFADRGGKESDIQNGQNLVMIGR